MLTKTTHSQVVLFASLHYSSTKGIEFYSARGYEKEISCYVKERSRLIPTGNFPCYLHSTGGMLGEGMACDDDEDDAIDLCAS